MLNTISAYWHMIGVGVIVAVLFLVPDDHRSFGSVFSDTVNETGWGGGTTSGAVFFYVFLTGLLMAQYTITGFDASAHVAEETREASRSAAVGMYMSVVASVVFGFILLVAVTRALPIEPQLDLYIVPSGWVAAMGENWGTFILFICVVAQMFCLTASVTSASRMMFAFSRDRAVPGHRLWRQVSANRIPRNAVIAICVLAAALMLPTLYNFFIGYYVGTGIAVIGLYIAFILPVDPALPDEGRVRAGRVDARDVTTSGSTRSRSCGSSSSASSSCCRRSTSARRGTRASPGRP